MIVHGVVKCDRSSNGSRAEPCSASIGSFVSKPPTAKFIRKMDPDAEVGLSVSAIGASIMLYFAHQALAPSLFVTSGSLVSRIRQRRKIFQDINFI
jgi:hypothetical protein